MFTLASHKSDCSLSSEGAAQTEPKPILRIANQILPAQVWGELCRRRRERERLRFCQIATHKLTGLPAEGKEGSMCSQLQRQGFMCHDCFGQASSACFIQVERDRERLLQHRWQFASFGCGVLASGILVKTYARLCHYILLSFLWLYRLCDTTPCLSPAEVFAALGTCRECSEVWPRSGIRLGCSE